MQCGTRTRTLCKAFRSAVAAALLIGCVVCDFTSNSLVKGAIGKEVSLVQLQGGEQLLEVRDLSRALVGVVKRNRRYLLRNGQTAHRATHLMITVSIVVARAQLLRSEAFRPDLSAR